MAIEDDYKIIRMQPFDFIVKDLDTGKIIREVKKEDNPAFNQYRGRR